MDGTHGIAILPFTDMSPQRDQEYFCEGLAEERINALGGVHGIRIILNLINIEDETHRVGLGAVETVFEFLDQAYQARVREEP